MREERLCVWLQEEMREDSLDITNCKEVVSLVHAYFCDRTLA